MSGKIVFGAIYLLVLSAHSTFAQQRAFPKSLPEMGIMSTQFAYRVPVEIILVDYDALRRDFPSLRKKSKSYIDNMIRKQAGLVSQHQLSLRGSLTTDYEIEKTANSVYPFFHPLHYSRASIVPFMREGLLDLKGSGLAPLDGFNNMGLTSLSVLALRLLVSQSQVDRERIEDLKAVYDSFENLKKNSERELRELTERNEPIEEIRAHRLSLEKAKMTQNAYGNLIEFLETGNTSVRDQAIQSFRNLDYRNGSMSLDRAVKEMLVQKMIQRVFNEYNRDHGTSFGTVDTYFVLKLPYSIWSGNKERPAAIVGRQASWRLPGVSRNHITYPDGIAGAGLGSTQTTLLGDLVDFELVSSLDPRIRDLISWNENPLSQKIDSELEQVLSDYLRGKKRSFKKYYRANLARIKRVKIDSSVSASDELDERWLSIIQNPNQEPDFFDFFQLARDLQAVPKKRGQLIRLFERGILYWPAPVTYFICDSVDEGHFASFNSKELIGIFKNLQKRGRMDLMMRIIHAMKPNDLDFLPSLFRFSHQDRIFLTQAVERGAVIFRADPGYRDMGFLEMGLIYDVQSLINTPEDDPNFKTEASRVRARLKEILNNPISNMDGFFFPLEMLLGSGKAPTETLQLLRRLSPPFQEKMSFTCRNAIAALSKT